MLSEFDFIRRIRERLGGHAQIPLGPGDDAAVVRLAGGADALVAVDMMIEGVHFDLSTTEPRLVGRKALAINLSDIAAMAGRPVAALVSVALPRSGGARLGEQILAGMQELAEHFHVGIAGGDTNSWNGPLLVSVTIVGEVTGAGPVRRGGAVAGDWVLVTGQLGGSLAGKHLEFQPRVAEAQLLNERYTLNAMIDLSDGLASDLGRILEESRCGALLRRDAVPISAAARSAGDDRSPLEHAMSDGEDFELCLSAPEEAARRMLDDQPLDDVPLTHVGWIVPEQGFWWEDAEGRRVPLDLKGYEHPLG